MPFHEFTTGIDTRVVIQGGTYGLVEFNIVTQFHPRQDTADIKVNGLDGVTRGAFVPMGWSGSFEIERGDSAADDFIAKIEADYYNGKPINAGTMYEFQTNPTDSLSTYQYEGVVFRMSDAGQRRKDQAVRMTIEWFASTRKKA